MGIDGERSPSPDGILEEMEALEPSTTNEVASRVAARKRRVRDILTRLSEEGRIRRKELGSEQTIWIRDAPVHECPNCDHTHEVKYLHPILSSVRFCHHCGSQL